MLDNKTLEAVATSIRLGQYSLLLGSGVSLDSKIARATSLRAQRRFGLNSAA